MPVPRGPLSVSSQQSRSWHPEAAQLTSAELHGVQLPAPPSPQLCPQAPHLSHHGLGKDLCPVWPAQHIGRLQKDLGPVCDRLQVPLFPGGQGSLDGFVEQGLKKRKRLGASSYSSKGRRGMSEGRASWRPLSTRGRLLAPSALSPHPPRLQTLCPTASWATPDSEPVLLPVWRSLRALPARPACQALGTGSFSC